MPEVSSYAQYGGASYPQENQVLDGIAFGDTFFSFEGSYVPAVADYPSEDDVRDGVSYNSGGNTGNLELPLAGDVREGVGYGSNGTELFGTLVVGAGTPVYPAQEDVRDQVRYGTEGELQFTGNVVLPNEGTVQEGVTYDSNNSRTGTLNISAGPKLKVY